MDLGIFHKIKLTHVVYTHGSARSRVVATDRPSQHYGVVVVCYWTATHFAVEAVQKFGFNVVGFQLVTEERRWYIVVCYLASTTPV